MQTLTLALMHEGQVVQKTEGQGSLYLAHRDQYVLGDYYQITASKTPAFLVVQLDAALKPALIYLPKSSYNYKLPFNLQREWPYPQGAFASRQHYATVRTATASEIAGRRNLAENSHDLHDDTGAFPHATANAETRGEYVFYARNAIDGMVANESHGDYPFQSWGIDGRADAALTVDFGRKVAVDEVAVILRADFPHDSCWNHGNLDFDDGSHEALRFKKTAEAQHFQFAQRTIQRLTLNQLTQAPEAAGFTALTELQVFGTEI